MNWRCELHCHSRYSPDCNVSLEQIISLCEKRKLNVLALTDHNEIAGSVKLKEMAPDWLTIIVGEEVATAQGDLIGLFLTEKIPARLDIQETINIIHEQGGLALLPHPFDGIRKEAVGLRVAEKIKDQIDFIEVFNGRCLFPSYNYQAAQFAQKNNLFGFVGSDAHLAREYGRSTCLIQPFHNANEFKQNLRQAQLTQKAGGFSVHVETKWVKFRKKP